MHAIESVKTQKIEGLVVCRHDKEVDIPLPKAYTREQIPIRREQIPRPEMARKFKHLNSIAEKIPPYNEALKVGLLISNNCVRAIKPRVIVPGKSAEPYAILTSLGWCVIGASADGKVSTDDNVAFAGCHRIATREISGDNKTPMEFVMPVKCNEVMTPLAVQRMFEMDFSETKVNEKPMSQDDIIFMKITTSGIHTTNDGHYEMPLPLRDDTVVLPCNRKLAEIRLSHLKRRFDRSPAYKKDYAVFMEDMLQKGYAKKGPKRGPRKHGTSPSRSIPPEEARED